jgi:hypothetical protein
VVNHFDDLILEHVLSKIEKRALLQNVPMTELNRAASVNATNGETKYRSYPKLWLNPMFHGENQKIPRISDDLQTS